MNIDLVRVGSSAAGTFGVLRRGQVPFALTLERPWQDNQANVSCIPPSEYVCKRARSPRFGETFEVMGVDRRSHILFHKGNTIGDTQGCILVGEEFSVDDNGTPVLAASARGYGEFMGILKGYDEFVLRIQEA